MMMSEQPDQVLEALVELHSDLNLAHRSLAGPAILRIRRWFHVVKLLELILLIILLYLDYISFMLRITEFRRQCGGSRRGARDAPRVPGAPARSCKFRVTPS